MRLAILGLLTVLCLTFASRAWAGDPYDPSDYLKGYTGEDHSVKEPKTGSRDVKQSEVYMGGKPYIKFTSAGGSIYVPKVSNLSKEDLDRALCGQPALREGCDRNHPEKCTDPQGEQKGIGQSTVLRGEVPLTQDYVAYADLIVRTINQKCDATGNAPNFSQRGPTLELGVEKKAADGQPGTQKAFIRTNDPQAPSFQLKPQVGAGITF